ncbi:MAG TPA: DUF3379 family protein [Rhodanobacteraceae bacterium]|jgi:hypothetical protein|nr:DUF3379 family protein [Rhodanobacteraceae bacterium]
MNCLEFRRQLGVDPQSSAADFVGHRQECARCAEAAARALEFEATLRRVLNVAPSKQLAESILLAQATRQQRGRQTWLRRGGLLALAATLVVAVGIGMRVEASPLSAQAVEHLRGEPEALTLSQPVPPESVREAFATRGIVLKHDISGEVVFVGRCPMGSHLTVHMVMPGNTGPVTVIYVVDDRVKQREDFQREGWRGRSVPLGSGTLILLGRESGQFDGIEAQWRTAVQG